MLSVSSTTAYRKWAQLTPTLTVLIHILRIAKGDSVSIPALLIHRSTDLWGPDANEWKPERWMDECGISVAAKTIPGLYSNTLAFLGGSHACIGWKFSLYE